MAKQGPQMQRRTNNRKDRRAVAKDALADCRERVGELEHKVAELERERAALIEVHNTQSQIIESVRQNGQITVLLDDRAPDDKRIYTTLETAQDMATKTFWQGAERMQRSQAQFFFAVGQVWSYIAGLQLLCFANGGDATSKALADTAAALLAALDRLDSTILELERDPLIEIDRAKMGPMLDQCQQVREHAKRYIAAGAKDRPAIQAAFRQFVATINPGLQPLYYAVTERPRGGRGVEAGTATLLDMGARLYGLRKDCLDYPSTERVIRLELEHKAQRSADEDAALMRLKYASVPGNVLRPLMNQHKDAPRSELIPNGTAPEK